MSVLATGLIGGTFDPIHIAHLVMAEQALEQCDLATVVFVPAARPPHKRGVPMAPFEDRLEMVRRAVRGNARLEVSDLESRREEVSYTVDTVRLVKHERPGERLCLIVGADSLAQLSAWKSPAELLSECEFAVAPRPGFPSRDADPELGGRVRFLDMPLLDVSSSDIRERVRLGRSVRYLVPPEVESYIREKNLYT